MLHWFPGHMHKARKELAKIIPQIDIVFEIVDARAPEASANPILHDIAKDKPIIKILSKIDLADKATTKKWLAYYQNKAIALNTIKDKQASKKLMALAEKCAPKRGTILKPIRAVVVGIPNVGKSTLINLLAGKKIAKTGNEPAITKRQQNIMLARTFYLRDTPGIMSPSPKNEDASFRLAICGAIRDTAMDYPTAAYYFIKYMTNAHLENLCLRYALDKKTILACSEDETLKHIARSLGAIKNDGVENLHQAAEKLILDYRQGRIGSISLETPEGFELEKLAYEIEPSE
jgi:ribosome biogenesis GTPase A